MNFSAHPDLLCFSHLRWGFVYQRPQHLMSRFAMQQRVFYIEEPVSEGAEAHLREHVCPKTGVTIITPVVPSASHQINPILRDLLAKLLAEHEINSYISWYYTPMAMEFTGNLDPKVTVYDCMDELSAFAGAPPSMLLNEEALFRQSDLVFTGGASLYKSKRHKHASVHMFPSSIDTAHFSGARAGQTEPQDQRSIGRPKIGYSGVIDERMDIHLVRDVARLRPHWQLILLGPVVKIDPATLPQAPNIHYLGMKNYADLPAYLSGWSIGMLPFALNESTRFISPTKTPEYLAAGLRVISTPIQDVVDTYGQAGLATIISTPEEFVAAAEGMLAEGRTDDFNAQARDYLARSSWDQTWNEMNTLINRSLTANNLSSAPSASHV